MSGTTEAPCSQSALTERIVCALEPRGGIGLLCALLLFCVWLGACATVSEIRALHPRPAIDTSLPAGTYELVLAQRVRGNFDIPARGTAPRIRVFDFTKTLVSGFDDSFGRHHQGVPSSVRATISIEAVELSLESMRRQPTAVAMLHSSDDAPILVHGSHGRPGVRAPSPLYARLYVRGFFRGSSLPAPVSFAFSVYSTESVGQLGSRTAAVRSAVEEMFRRMSQELAQSLQVR